MSGAKPFGSKGGQQKYEVLDIHELLDIDIKRFERDNSIKLVPSFNNLRETSAKKSATKTHFESMAAVKKTGIMIPKKKVSDYHFQVSASLGKRHHQDNSFLDSYTPKPSAKKTPLPLPSKARLETVQIKKNHFARYLDQKLKAGK